MNRNKVEYETAKELSAIAVKWAEDQLEKIEVAREQGPEQLAQALEKLTAKEANAYSLMLNRAIKVERKLSGLKD